MYTIRQEMDAIGVNLFIVANFPGTDNVPLLNINGSWFPCMVNDPQSRVVEGEVCHLMPYRLADPHYLFPVVPDDDVTYFCYHNGSVTVVAEGIYFTTVELDQSYEALLDRIRVILASDRELDRIRRVDGFLLSSSANSLLILPSPTEITYMLAICNHADIEIVKRESYRCYTVPGYSADYSAIEASMSPTPSAA